MIHPGGTSTFWGLLGKEGGKFVSRMPVKDKNLGSAGGRIKVLPTSACGKGMKVELGSDLGKARIRGKCCPSSDHEEGKSFVVGNETAI